MNWSLLVAGGMLTIAFVIVLDELEDRLSTWWNERADLRSVRSRETRDATRRARTTPGRVTGPPSSRGGEPGLGQGRTPSDGATALAMAKSPDEGFTRRPCPTQNAGDRDG